MAERGLTLIIQTKALDRIHYALMLAVSNAAMDGPTTLFFAIEGVEALRALPWGRLSTAAGEDGDAFIERLENAGAATPDELLMALNELEARLTICDTGLAVAGLTQTSLRQDFQIEVTGLTEIISSAGQTNLVYV
jgi:peroxiredoxin family protein